MSDIDDDDASHSHNNSTSIPAKLVDCARGPGSTKNSSYRQLTSKLHKAPRELELEHIEEEGVEQMFA